MQSANLTWPVIAWLVAAVAGAVTGRAEGQAARGRQVMPITAAEIEADWLRQAEVRIVPDRPGPVTVEEDAAGGCDGIRTGLWGFHTGRRPDPWWQVDLGREIAIGEILIYNRCDACPDRAARLRILVSPDGTRWTEVYRHNGTVFGGMLDRRPLSVLFRGVKGRFIRIQLPGNTCLHLDEVEVFDTGYHRNHALGKPATQSSVSVWSKRHPAVALQEARRRGGSFRPTYGGPYQTDWLSIQAQRGNPRHRYPVVRTVERGRKLAESLRGSGMDVQEALRTLDQIALRYEALPEDAPADAVRDLYLEAQWAVRRLAFSNPLLDFERLLFVRRALTSFKHMSDQYYGWFSRPGGGLYVLENFKGERPRIRCLTGSLPPGNVLRPDLSYDGRRVLFAYCRYYPDLAELENKLDKSQIPEDAFYHLYEINVDGSGLRRLTYGKYDDFDGRYLPNGEIVFLSTRKGQFVQLSRTAASLTCSNAELPDSFVRCGGGPERPVAVYTLHVMDGEGTNLRPISAFESFEWTPSVANDGRILYARWDYIDREAMPYMSLWATLPDGSGAQAVYGNFTVNPYAIFEARGIPGSRKLVFTASAHHYFTGGSLVLLDPSKGTDGPAPLRRLTPEVPFPEVEAWPASYYANPYPLSEDHFLVAWSDREMFAPTYRDGDLNPVNPMGIYLYDAFGNLNLIHRDPELSSMYPLPIRPRPRPAALAPAAQWDAGAEGQLLVLDVYQGLAANWSGRIQRLRIVGVTPKTHPTMHYPPLGVTRNDTGKFVLGTVPVEEDGSAFFRVPAGVPFFLQALDKEGMAVQTMRSVTYVGPGRTQACIGCHEPRNSSPPDRSPLAARRQASAPAPGPVGSWPLDFAILVQPVLDAHCVRCHRPEADTDGRHVDLTPQQAYDTLVDYGRPSLRDHVWSHHRRGFSTPGAGAAQTSQLLGLLKKGHYQVQLRRDDWERLITWMDTYAQKSGSFSPDQQQRLRQLRKRLAAVR
ncbi:MAG TPA: hypothetical protein EYH34_12160 [Planctomycetes bacterium]|nr:hypothetical protein [Planctomycetota bacterium]